MIALLRKKIKVFPPLILGILFTMFSNAAAQYSSLLVDYSTGPANYETILQSEKRISLEFERVPISRVFMEIAKAANVGLYFNATLLPDKEITLTLKDVKLEKALAMVLDGTGLEAKISGRNIMLRKINKEDNVPGKIGIQTGRVGGVVTDAETGEYLPGASLYIEGTTTGTSTDSEGKYSLSNLETGAYTLVATYIGYKVQSRQISIRENEVATINFELVSEQSYLDELVVTGYQELDRERVTGSFEKITTKELDQTTSFNIEDKLVGEISGLLTDPQGTTIRGVSTLNANRLPLIVIDGFPIQVQKQQNDFGEGEEFDALTRALETINPNDVESITVLKDAAATSIWGARASNGVIVITTKQSSSREPRIDFSTSYTITPQYDIDEMPFASPQTYFELERNRYEAGWFDSRLANANFPYNMTEYPVLRNQVEQGLASQAELDVLEQQMRTYDNRYEFSDYFLRNQTRKQVNLSISQNTGFNIYRFSASYDDNQAITKENNNNRLILNLTNQFRPAQWLTINFGSNLHISNETANGVDMSDLFPLPQHKPILDENGNYTSMSAENLGIFTSKAVREELQELAYVPYDWEWNIKREFDNRDNTIRATDLRLQGGLDIRPFGNDMLTIEMQYQYERGAEKIKNLYNEEMYLTRDKVNNFAQPDGSLPVPKGSILDHRYGTSDAHTGRLVARYHDSFLDRHDIAILVGSEILDQESDRSNIRRYGYDDQSLDYARQMDYANTYRRNLAIFNSAYYIESSFSDIYDYWQRTDRFFSVFGNIAYTLNSKYDLTGSWRLDKSNSFGDSPKYRDIPLWSVGAGWTISKESFFNISFVDRFRLRATYGASGNIDKTTSPYAIAAIGGSQNNGDIGLQGAQFTGPANPDLRWEQTKTFNLGTDFSLFNHLIDGRIEYYNRKSSDLLTTKRLNSTYGFTSASINSGSMVNKGIEIDLAATVVSSGDFRWRTQLIHSYNHNKVTETDIDIDNISVSFVLSDNNNRVVKGRPRYNLISIPWGGLDEEGYPQFYHDGELHSWDTDLGTSAYGFDNFQYEGPSRAPHFGSWRNTFNYKGFELSFLAVYKFGHKYLHTSLFRVANNDLFGFAQGNYIPHYAEAFEDRWKQSGDENSTDIPKLPFELSGAEVRSQSAWYSYSVNYGSHQIESAAHIRLQRVTLAYSLKREWLPTAIKDITLAIQGRNLALINFNKFEEDPENQKDMFGNFLRDTQPEYTFSVRASF